MFIHNLISIVPVLLGAAMLIASIFISRTIRTDIPNKVKNKWRIVDGLMCFFAVAYIFHVVMLYQESRIPLEYIISTVFFAGASFVFIIINISKSTIRQVRRSEKKIQKMHNRLEDAYLYTVEGWGRALELRDRETEGHTKRVCEMALALANQFSLSDQTLKYIRIGALLHDIGKMGVPDRILHKKGPLTDEEKEIIQKHPVFAREMLEKIPFLQPALDIPYSHHERWDGTGYPQGLKGEEIPLAARIFAVADVWDALISKRLYHKPWKVETVCQHILDGSGTHFDPRVVEKFMQLDLCDFPVHFPQKLEVGQAQPQNNDQTSSKGASSNKPV